MLSRERHLLRNDINNGTYPPASLLIAFVVAMAYFAMGMAFVVEVSVAVTVLYVAIVRRKPVARLGVAIRYDLQLIPAVGGDWVVGMAIVCPDSTTRLRIQHHKVQYGIKKAFRAEVWCVAGLKFSGLKFSIYSDHFWVVAYPYSAPHDSHLV
jgi:hypothetical protein